ncbi:class V lanthionine synthetase subunit LxmK [Streptomyces sp. NPDC001594]|uniref:class V lanthionine synthetase subunit LxmK n=1 Tax=Streptomyces sp. NPDC001594 TaxID=3364590 RepID=UPI00368AF83A
MATRQTPRPVDLDNVPEVRRAIAGRGLGLLQPETVHSFRGRNDNWSGRTTNGAQVFVKKIEGPEARQRFSRTLFFEGLHRTDRVPVPAPRCLGWDEPSAIVIYELLGGARSAAELADDGAFTEQLAREAGAMVGRLHSMLVDSPELHRKPRSWPLLEDHEAVSAAAYAGASGALLEFWGLFQRDPMLAAAIDLLRDRAVQAPHTPVHGDLRLDQFLCPADGLRMIDWEEFRCADPAQDIGSFIGEWVCRAMVAGAADSTANGDTLMHSWAREMDRRMPYVRGFWDGYVCNRLAVDPELGLRTAGFTGWHVLDRVMAGCQEHHQLTALQKAQIGVARTLMLDPGRFLQLTGIGTNSSSKESPA